MLMLSRENEPKIRFSLYSYKRYMHFKDEFGADPGFQRSDFERRSQESIKEIRRYIGMARVRQRLGVTTEILAQESSVLYPL